MGRLKERDNFYRFNSLIVENGRQALVLLLDYYLTKIANIKLEEFLNNNLHEIFHLCYTSVNCCMCPRNSKLKYQKQILHSSQLEVLLDKNGTQLAGHKNEFCCCKAKHGILTDVLDVTLAYVLLKNFCEEVFWECCLSKQGKTFEMFLDDNKHDIYHIAFGNQPCCLCTPEYVSPISEGKLHDPNATWSKCYNGSLPQCSKHKGCVNGPSSRYPCTASSIPGIRQSMLDPRVREKYLLTFCEARKNVEIIRFHRNKDYAHVVCTSMEDKIYLPLKVDTRTAIKQIAQICGKEDLIEKAFQELDERSIDHELFQQHHTLMCQLLTKEFDLKEALPGLISEGIQIANDKNDADQRCFRNIKGSLNTIVSSENNMSSDAVQNLKSLIVDIDNHLEENNTSLNLRFPPEVTDLDSCIDVILTDVSNFPTISNKSKEIFQEVREEVVVLKNLASSDMSIEIYLKEKVSLILRQDQRDQYKNTVSGFVRQLANLIGYGISHMNPNVLNQMLQKVTLLHRNEFMIQTRNDLTENMKNITRKNFNEIMKVLIPYQYLCAIWKILVLYLYCIFDVNSSHGDLHIRGDISEIEYDRSSDVRLLRCFVEPTKDSVLTIFLYNRLFWQPMQICVNSLSCSQRNNNLREGRYKIFPATLRKSYVHKTNVFSFLRCSSGNHKCMQIRFQPVNEEESQFHIFLVDSRNLYLRMGCKFCVRFIKGNPQGDEKAIWKIVKISGKGVNCYMLATKESKDALLTFGLFGGVYGSKSQPSDKHLWIFEVVQEDSNSV